MGNFRLEEPCKHGFDTPLVCPICKDNLDEIVSPQFVYITAGGTDYHGIPTCHALEYGQELVRERGGNPAPIEMVAEASVKHERTPCKFCRKHGE